MSDRAVSNPVGIVLILGITIASVGVLFGVGGTVVSDTRADAERSQMENSMSGFSSKASLVGLGEASDQRFSLGRASEGQVDIREDAGSVSIYVERPDGTIDDIGTTSMGAVVYRNGDREIAYQGGGVWERQNDFSRMISPPEFHYQGETLTFPILNISGSGSATGDVRGTVRTGGTSQQLYPNTDENPEFTNPLTNGTVFVEIESEYCRGWQSFFEARSQGSVEPQCDGEGSGTVIVDLTIELDPVFGTAVTADRVENDGASVDSSREGIVAPSASSRVEGRIAECQDNNCNEWSDSPTSGTYYTEVGDDFSDLTIDTNEDVDLVVNDLTGGVDISRDITVSGSGDVTVYLRTDGDITMSGSTSINEEDGNPGQFLTYVHSDTQAIKLSGNPTYVGGIYAPNTSLEGDQGGGGGCGAGNVQVTGSVLVSNFCFNNGNFTHDPVMDDVEVEVDADTIKFLHVSENNVTVELN